MELRCLKRGILGSFRDDNARNTTARVINPSNQQTAHDGHAPSQKLKQQYEPGMKHTTNNEKSEKVWFYTII
jgi:hypothetical protein